MRPIFLYTQAPELYNEICEEIRLFLSTDKIEALTNPPETGRINTGLLFVHTVSMLGENHGRSSVQIFDENRLKASADSSFVLSGDISADRRARKFAAKCCVYAALKRMTHKRPPWGALTGIRPTRMLRDLEERAGEVQAKRDMTALFDVSNRKINLAKQIISRQRPIIESASAKAMDIYIGIPFCPSICAYCSFSSTRTHAGDGMQTVYLTALEKEITALKHVIKMQDIRAVYIGGGTPTSLDNGVFERLLSLVRALIPKAKEFTVEAGRPDTITEEKLRIMKKHGVSRISINPQTFSDAALKRVERHHTVADFMTAFQLARKMAFDHINIDLIFGLPGEDVHDMKKSLRQAIRLSPESLTIHTLAIKNASKLKRETVDRADERMIAKAVEIGRRRCESAGLYPYYMYRQKYMKGNLENVGYCREGFESIYNIDMMEEICSILAFGAGAISKRVYAGENRLERNANTKDVRQYIARIDEMIDAQKRLFNE